MTRKRFVLGVLLLMLVTVPVGAVSPAAGNDGLRGQFFATSTLVGTWDVKLNLPGVPPGAARVLATFTSDGGTVESANSDPRERGASHGVWKRTGRDLFSVTRIFFRFDKSTGAYLGTTKVNATVRVAPDGETFNAVSISELRGLTGNLVLGGLRGTATGTRVHVEEIPDQP